LKISELVTRFETAQEARKRLEKQLADAKKELNTQMKSMEDANRELKRLEERLRASDSEKTITENARRKLEEEVRRLKTIIDQSDADGVKKALEEAEAQNRFIEEEYKTRYFFVNVRQNLHSLLFNLSIIILTISPFFHFIFSISV
uniref:Myosin_tail_1 domain-containing protein n=1 Tax=Ascaris lumbricoides TaxID=6252 RepID=A0A0M3HG33_ASCLU